MAAICISIIMLMRVIQSLYNKKASLILPNGLKEYVLYIMISKILASGFAVITLIALMDFSGFNAQAVLIATCSGICLTISSACGIKALSGGTIVLNSIFATAGLIIPCFLGIFLFDEPMSIMQIVCIFILIGSVVLLIDSSKKIFAGFSPSTLKYLIGSFVSNGLVMFCQKAFGKLQPDGNVSLFSLLTFLIPSLFLGVIFLFMKKRGVPGKSEADSIPVVFPKKLIIYAVFLSFAVFVIQQLVTVLTPLVSSAVLFTFVNGGATVIAAVVGAIVYKEKITLKSGLGILIGISMLVCIKIFE